MVEETERGYCELCLGNLIKLAAEDRYFPAIRYYLNTVGRKYGYGETKEIRARTGREIHVVFETETVSRPGRSSVVYPIKLKTLA